MKYEYDVVIVGAGIAGICAAYELSLKTNLKILLLDQGRPINSRVCPMISNKGSNCANCVSCNIMKGFGGAGNFSDGKYNFTTEFGGWLNQYISNDEVEELIDYVDSINMKFGATDETFSTSTKEAKEIERKALQNDLHLLHAKVKHLGTENNLKILKNFFEYLNDKVDIVCNKKVEHILPKHLLSKNEDSDNKHRILFEDNSFVKCDFAIIAPGRSGAEWFSNECRSLGVELINNQIDIGVRVELPAEVFKDITESVYEAKLKYRTKKYGDIVRTFCMNPYGHVVAENVDGLITVNGHSYSDKSLRSENTNFALLVSNTFTEPFNDPYQYGKRIASFSNLLGNGVIVQRFGDLIKGRRTNTHRMSKSFVTPTLKASPGDLSLVLPKRHLDNIIEMIYALDKIAPGTANEDTLLYGVEVKFYSARPKLTNELEISFDNNVSSNQNIFAIGDGAGVTRGLAQAGASGIYVARRIIERVKK